MRCGRCGAKKFLVKGQELVCNSCNLAMGQIETGELRLVRNCDSVRQKKQGGETE